MTQKKNITCRLISRGKINLSRKHLAKKHSYIEKIPFMAYNAGKNVTPLYVRKKNSITRFLRKKKFVQKPNHPHPPSNDKWSVPKLTMLRPAERLCNLYIPSE